MQNLNFLFNFQLVFLFLILKFFYLAELIKMVYIPIFYIFTQHKLIFSPKLLNKEPNLWEECKQQVQFIKMLQEIHLCLFLVDFLQAAKIAFVLIFDNIK